MKELSMNEKMAVWDRRTEDAGLIERVGVSLAMFGTLTPPSEGEGSEFGDYSDRETREFGGPRRGPLSKLRLS